MELPATLEPYRGKRLWCCYPLIWDAKRHNGFGGYAKPPINPHTLTDADTRNPENLGTYDEAAARIGQVFNYYGQRLEVKGVGLSLTLSGLIALDLDSVARLTPDTPGQQGRATREAVEILQLFDTYTEVSPSGDGLHLFFTGELPAEIPRQKAKDKRDIRGGTAAEYELKTSGYMTVSGVIAGDYDTIKDRTEQLVEFCRKYLAEDPAKDPAEADGVPAKDPAQPKKPARRSEQPKGNGFYSWERWKEEADGLSDPELMERIYTTPRIGAKVRALYENGDISNYNNDHSFADLNLCSFLYGFTHDRGRTERLFVASALYRKKGKSKSYVSWLSKRAEADGWQFIGTIKGEPTKDDRREYAKAREAEETARKELKARAQRSDQEGQKAAGRDPGEDQKGGNHNATL